MPCVGLREAICMFLDNIWMLIDLLYNNNCLITMTHADLFALLCPGADVYVKFFIEIGYIKLACINMYDNTLMICAHSPQSTLRASPHSYGGFCPQPSELWNT